MSAPPVARDKIDAYGLDAVCADLANGTTLTDISKSLDVVLGSLLAWCEAEPERSARVRESRTKAARLWDEKAAERIDSAKNPFELAKAKELAFHYRWRASKTAPKEYGEKLDLNHSGEIRSLRDDQLESRLVDLLGKTGTAGGVGGT